MILYHYCCSHSAALIERDGFVRPTYVTWKELDRLLVEQGWPTTGLAGQPQVSWLTDLPVPSRSALGLFATPGICDRTEYRVTVDTDRAEPWTTWALLRLARRDWRLGLEVDTEPRRWWVSEADLRVVSIEPVERVVA